MVIQPEKIYFFPVTLYVTSGIVTEKYTASVTLEDEGGRGTVIIIRKNNFIKLNLNGGGK